MVIKLNSVIKPPKSPEGGLLDYVVILFSLPPMGERWREATERGLFSGQVIYHQTFMEPGKRADTQVCPYVEFGI